MSDDEMSASEIIMHTMDDLSERIGRPLSFWVCMREPGTHIDSSVQRIPIALGKKVALDHARAMKATGQHYGRSIREGWPLVYPNDTG